MIEFKPVLAALHETGPDDRIVYRSEAALHC